MVNYHKIIIRFLPTHEHHPVNNVRAEIEGIEQTVTREREKYQLSTQAISSGLSAIPVMTINDAVKSLSVYLFDLQKCNVNWKFTFYQMTLSADDASYILSLELPSEFPAEIYLFSVKIKPVKFSLHFHSLSSAQYPLRMFWLHATLN